MGFYVAVQAQLPKKIAIIVQIRLKENRMEQHVWFAKKDFMLKIIVVINVQIIVKCAMKKSVWFVIENFITTHKQTLVKSAELKIVMFVKLLMRAKFVEMIIF